MNSVVSKNLHRLAFLLSKQNLDRGEKWELNYLKKRYLNKKVMVNL